MLNNQEKEYSSAADAYNYAIKNLSSTCQCIIFSHQDIVFFDNTIVDIYEHCMSEPSTIFGSAGVKNKKRSNIISSMHQIKEGWRYSSLINREEEVFTLDECLIACNKKVVDKIQFDPISCSGWHLYAADFCINGILNGFSVKVIDADLLHLSPGHIDKAFIVTEKKLAKKYKSQYEVLTFTNSYTYTNFLLRNILCWYRILKYCPAEMAVTLPFRGQSDKNT